MFSENKAHKYVGRLFVIGMFVFVVSPLLTITQPVLLKVQRSHLAPAGLKKSVSLSIVLRGRRVLV